MHSVMGEATRVRGYSTVIPEVFMLVYFSHLRTISKPVLDIFADHHTGTLLNLSNQFVDNLTAHC